MIRSRQALLTGAPVVVAGLGAWAHRWITEDAFIVVRVARQLAAGNGPVFNVGERAEAATSTAWLALVALLDASIGRVADIGWVLVILGLLLTGLALVAAQRGSDALDRARGRLGVALPFAIWIPALLPAFWDFATSGLETSLVFAWLASSFWGLAVRSHGDGDRSPADPWWLSVLLGAGPLIRPDLAVFSLTFVVALWLLSARGVKGRLASTAMALTLPVAIEILRMGYYGSVVPTTALAKSASGANWAQGWTYLADLVGPYRLVVPALVLLGAVGVRTWAPGQRPDRSAGTRRARVVVVATEVAALISAAYVVRLGGDFMHARFLLPALFAAVMPLAAVRVDLSLGWAPRAVAALAALTLVWGITASRVVLPYAGSIDRTGITDERRWWESLAGRPNPVTLADYDRSIVARRASEMQAQARGIGPDALVIDEEEVQAAMPAQPGVGTVLSFPNIGVFGMDVPLDTHVHDWHGLSDPVAARVTAPGSGGRPGHDKKLPAAWAIARYGAPRADDPPEVLAARRALRCGQLAEVISSTTEPMSVGRFLTNLRGALRWTRVSVPADPFEAERTFCAAPDP